MLLLLGLSELLILVVIGAKRPERPELAVLRRHVLELLAEHLDVLRSAVLKAAGAVGLGIDDARAIDVAVAQASFAAMRPAFAQTDCL
jgi:hypothetical protein